MKKNTQKQIAKKKYDSEIHAIIPAAGKSINAVLTRSGLPDTMVPINGSPIISYIIADLILRKIYDITIVLSIDDSRTEKFVKRRFGSKCNLSIVYNSEPNRGVGHSIYIGATQNRIAKPTLIYLGDTIYKGRLEFKRSLLVVSRKFEESKKWCFVEKEDKGGLKFINRPAKYKGDGKVLVGIYFFKNGKEFMHTLNKLKQLGKMKEIKDILDYYHKTNEFDLIPSSKWYDCGNVENYYKARIDFLKYRKFNNFKYNSFYGYITKSGSNVVKITQEINWYKNLPDDIRILSPRLLDYKILKKRVEYSLEFYGYPSLADLFIYESMDIHLWKVVIKHIFEITELFRKKRGNVAFDSYEKMYFEKTVNRIEEMKSNNKFKKKLNAKYLTINNKDYINAPLLMEEVKEYIKKLYIKNEMSFIHGDLCMSNILFDPTSRIFKIIDPRGQFGESDLYGDIKYDIAKLRHSFVSHYDFIVADLFEIDYYGNAITLDIYTEDSHLEVSKFFDAEVAKRGYNIKKIKLIESLLFLSMVPLHSGNEDRQMAMYCTGLKLLNDSGLFHRHD